LTLLDDHPLKPGTKVRRDAIWDDDTVKSEFGVVIHCWYEAEIAGYDCYVAFFGETYPAGPPPEKPAEKPYVLRYSAASLTVLPD